MRSLKLVTIILSIILISGCAMMPTKPPADPSNPMKRIAILPIKNDTTDVDGPNFVREKLISFMQQNHPESLPKVRIELEKDSVTPVNSTKEM